MTFFAEAPACGSRGQAKTACPPPPQAQLLLPKNRTHRLLHKPDNFRSSQQRGLNSAAKDLDRPERSDLGLKDWRLAQIAPPGFRHRRQFLVRRV
jgi:hypothetical protein